MASRIALVLAGVLAAAASSCYSPTIGPSLHCATAPGAKACPDGFACSGGLCVKAGAPGTASGGAVGSGGATGSGGVTGSGGAIATGGAVGSGGAGMVADKYKSCNITNAGSPEQKDNCAAGLKCIDDCGSSQHCYPICTTDAECPQSACTRIFPGQAGKFCEQPFTACDVLAPAGSANGCVGTLTCHLLSMQPAPAGGERTVCECQMGSQTRNESCSETRDCFGGLVCPPFGQPGGEKCQFLCDPMRGAAACTSGTCRPFGARWGYCF